MRGRLYDEKGLDRELDLAKESGLSGLTHKRRLLWLDVEAPEGNEAESREIAALAEEFDLGDSAHAWLSSSADPAVEEDADGCLLVSVVGYPQEETPVSVRCVVGHGWIVTAHDAEIDLIEIVNRPIHPASSNVGGLDGPRFLALVLDWVVRGLFDRVEELDRAVDDLDEKLIRRQVEGEDQEVLDHILDLRGRTASLRRAAVAHRQVLAPLADPDLITLSGSTSARRFRDLSRRLEDMVSSLDSTRMAIGGSLDVFMTMTAQRTNDVMKVLTLTSILLLPATVIAGVMGMNFQLGFFSNPLWFWAVLVLMGAVAGTTLLVARRRGWIGAAARRPA